MAAGGGGVALHRMQGSKHKHWWPQSGQAGAGHQLAGKAVTQTCGTCDSCVVQVVIGGHWWPPTLRQTTAMNPAPSALPWGCQKGQGHQHLLLPLPFLGVQAWWGGPKGQTPGPLPQRSGATAVDTVLNTVLLKNAKAGPRGLRASSRSSRAPHLPGLSRLSYMPPEVSGVAAGAPEGAGPGLRPGSAGTAFTF